MTVLQTVAAIAARLAPRLCPNAFYVILKGCVFLCGYSSLLTQVQKFSLECLSAGIWFSYYIFSWCDLIKSYSYPILLKSNDSRWEICSCFVQKYLCLERKKVAILYNMWTVSSVGWFSLSLQRYRRHFISWMHYLNGLTVPKRKVSSDQIGRPVLIRPC